MVFACHPLTQVVTKMSPLRGLDVWDMINKIPHPSDTPISDGNCVTLAIGLCDCKGPIRYAPTDVITRLAGGY